MNYTVTPYYSLNQYLKNRFGCKIAKLSINGGFTCPNRDGTLSTEGCIFCSEQGSGDFAGDITITISEQLKNQKQLLSKKWPNAKYIAYFQSFTNTYAPLEELRKKYYEALNTQDVVGIAIATRPDCLSAEVISLLKEISETHFVWVELGLQTSNESTAKYINRGYKNIVFETAVKSLNDAKIDVVVHVILGLAMENVACMLSSVRYACSLNIWGIKLQLLHVLDNTPLGEIYKKTPFKVLSKDEYLDIVCQCLEIIPPNIVIHRLTGDGAKKDLLAPIWSGNKKDVINSLSKTIRENGIFQGKNLIEKNPEK